MDRNQGNGMKIGMRGRYLLATLVCMLLFACPAFAATIGTVRINIGPEVVEQMSPGGTYSAMEPSTYDSIYYIYNWDTSSSHSTPMKSYEYKMDVRPASGYSFSEECAVEVYGGTQVTINSRTTDRIVFTVTTYPYYVLKNVTGITRSGDTYKWDRPSSSSKEYDLIGSYDVYIYYTDDDGDLEYTKKNVSKSSRSVDISSYDRNDRTFDHIVVRAHRASGTGAGYVANGLYVDEDGEVDSERSDDEFEFNIKTARSNAIANSQSSTSVSSGLPITGAAGGPGVTGNNTVTNGTNWVQENGKWYYELNGKRLTGWINPVGDDWYLMDSSGAMLSGWQLVDGYWFLLNPQHDGSYGKLLTQWWQVNGKWYYLNPYKKNGMPYGAMFSNGTTPDGYTVGTDGAWLG